MVDGFQLNLSLPSLSGTHTIFENLSYDFFIKVVERAGSCGVPTQSNFSCGNWAGGIIQVSVTLVDLTLNKGLGKSHDFGTVRSAGNFTSCWGGTCSNVSGLINANPAHFSGVANLTTAQAFRASDSYAMVVELSIQVYASMVGINDTLHGSPYSSGSVTAGPTGSAMTIQNPGIA